MKTLLLLLIGCAASAVAQTTILPYDRLGRDNVTMRLEASSGKVGKGTKWGYIAGNKAVDVSISPVASNSAPVILELYAIKESPNYLPFARLVEKKQADFGAAKKCHFEFGKTGDSSLKGWVVRAVRDNRVVGYVASAYEYEKFATDAALLDEYVKRRFEPTEREKRYQEKYRQRYGAN